MSRLFSSSSEAAQTAHERWQERIRAHRLKLSLMKINQLIEEMRDCHGSEHNKKENV
jgi:hypothetical protein